MNHWRRHSSGWLRFQQFTITLLSITNMYAQNRNKISHCIRHDIHIGLEAERYVIGDGYVVF